jgi:hypothetical protein
MKVQLTVQIEVSDHDGYCSGNECEYTKKSVIKNVDMPDQTDIFSETFKWDTYLTNLIPAINENGSYYCYADPDAAEQGLGQHDYKITVTNVTVIE